MKMGWMMKVAVAASALAACGGGGAKSPDLGSPDLALPTETCTAPAGPAAKYVTATVTIPTDATKLAFDLNGDGKADNALGDIASILKTQNIDLQVSANEAVMKGDLLVLLHQRADASLDADSCQIVDLYNAVKPATPPALNGSDTLNVDVTANRGRFVGEAGAGVFTSGSPAKTTMPVSFTLKIPLAVGRTPVRLGVTAGRVTFRRVGNGLVEGQLNGGVPKAQFDEAVLPDLTALLNERVATVPADKPGILRLFDKGMCTNKDGSMALAGDEKIDYCEVATNPVVQTILTPDVQLFDAMGTYAPNPSNSEPDTISIGIGFTAVAAAFNPQP